MSITGVANAREFRRLIFRFVRGDVEEGRLEGSAVVASAADDKGGVLAAAPSVVTMGAAAAAQGGAGNDDVVPLLTDIRNSLQSMEGMMRENSGKIQL